MLHYERQRSNHNVEEPCETVQQKEGRLIGGTTVTEEVITNVTEYRKDISMVENSCVEHSIESIAIWHQFLWVHQPRYMRHSQRIRIRMCRIGTHRLVKGITLTQRKNYTGKTCISTNIMNVAIQKGLLVKARIDLKRAQDQIADHEVKLNLAKSKSNKKVPSLVMFMLGESYLNPRQPKVVPKIELRK